MVPKVLKYIDKLFIEKDGSFKFSARSPSTLLATDFAVSTMYLLEGAEKLKEYGQSKEYLLSAQSEADIFIDPLFNPKDTFGSHSTNYIINQFTYFTLIALDHLGEVFSSLRFYQNEFADEKKIRSWINQLDFSRFWYVSNEIMFIFYFSSYLLKYGDVEAKNLAERNIDILFEVLNEKQDPDTGYWGTELNNRNLIDGCYGAAHILLFYDYFKKDIRYTDKIIDNTLFLHSENGLMGNKYGGACEDYDAIDIYLRCMRYTDHRKSDIISQLLKMKEQMLKRESPSGGFPYRISNNPIRRTIKIAMKRSYRYSGWGGMETLAYLPDIWATWFRSMSLAVIDLITENKKDFYSYSLPAWGFIDLQYE